MCGGLFSKKFHPIAHTEAGRFMLSIITFHRDKSK
ncbi:MAG: hypothetical protein ACFWUC_03100 [Oscillospiraceae bacterium]